MCANKHYLLAYLVIIYLMLRVYIFSGGTLVTVYGSNLNSVAEPRITLTVITTRFYNDSDSAAQVGDGRNFIW